METNRNHLYHDARQMALGYVFNDDDNDSSYVHHEHEQSTKKDPLQQDQRQRQQSNSKHKAESNSNSNSNKKSYCNFTNQLEQQNRYFEHPKFAAAGPQRKMPPLPQKNNNNEITNDHIHRIKPSNSVVRREHNAELQQGRDFAVQLALGCAESNHQNNNKNDEDDNDDNDYEVFTTMREERLQQKLALQNSGQMLPQPLPGSAAAAATTTTKHRMPERTSAKASLPPPRSSVDSLPYKGGDKTRISSSSCPAATTTTSSSSSSGKVPQAPKPLRNAVTIGAIWVGGISSATNTPALSQTRRETYPNNSDSISSQSREYPLNMNVDMEQQQQQRHDPSISPPPLQTKHPKQSSRMVLFSCLAITVILAVSLPLAFLLGPDDQTLPNNQNQSDLETQEPPYLLTDYYPPGMEHAYVRDTICREDIPGQGRSELCRQPLLLSRGGGACNLVAQAFLEQTTRIAMTQTDRQSQTIDLALVDAGSCRSDIEAGSFTTEDAMELLPDEQQFLYVVELSGSQILLLLSKALQAVFLDDVSAAVGAPAPTKPNQNEQIDGINRNVVANYYPYAAGMRFHVDASADIFDRVFNVQIRRQRRRRRRLDDASSTYNSSTVDNHSNNNEYEDNIVWEPLELDATYLVVTSETIATNRKYQVVPTSNFQNTGMRTTATFIDYAREQAILVDLQPSDYSTQVFQP